MEKHQAALENLHEQASKLQQFAAQSKRKLSRSMALEQAAQLNGFPDYQTAKGSIGKDKGKKKNLTVVEITPWDEEAEQTNGECSIELAGEYVSVKLAKKGSPLTEIELILEMDVGFPRAILYTPGKSDEPLISIHSAQEGIVLQHLPDDDQMFHKNKASEVGVNLIKQVAHADRGVWFLPISEVTEEN